MYDVTATSLKTEQNQNTKQKLVCSKRLSLKNKNEQFQQTPQDIKNDLNFIDYEQNKLQSKLKYQKNTIEQLRENHFAKYRSLYWKYVLSDGEKDLRPVTLLGKIGEETVGVEKNDNRLSKLIDEMQDDTINVGKYVKETYKLLESGQKKRKKKLDEGKKQRKFVYSLLEKSNSLLKKVTNNI